MIVVKSAENLHDGVSSFRISMKSSYLSIHYNYIQEYMFNNRLSLSLRTKSSTVTGHNVVSSVGVNRMLTLLFSNVLEVLRKALLFGFKGFREQYPEQ